MILVLLLYVVAVDGSSGSVYVTGYAQGAMDGQIYVGGADIVLMKFDASGAWQWTRQKGTSLNDRGYGGEHRENNYCGDSCKLLCIMVRNNNKQRQQPSCIIV